MFPSKRKILVVEDFDDSRRLLEIYLKSLGFDVFEASNGREALENAILFHPDLIIMDITMPHMDGHEATALLKENPSTRQIPIVVMTAHTGAMQIRAAREAGACEVLIKPVEFGVLREMLDRYLHAHADTRAPFQKQSSKGL